MSEVLGAFSADDPLEARVGKVRKTLGSFSCESEISLGEKKRSSKGAELCHEVFFRSARAREVDIRFLSVSWYVDICRLRLFSNPYAELINEFCVRSKIDGETLGEKTPKGSRVRFISIGPHNLDS